MNISRISLRLKMGIGIYGIALPIIDIDDFVVKILTDITLPTFSLFLPLKKVMYLGLDDMEKLEKNATFESYLLPEQVNRILYVKDVRYDDRSMAYDGYLGGPVVTRSSGYDAFKSVTLGNQLRHMMNEALPTITFHFEAPRTIFLFNVVQSRHLVFELCCEHDKSFMSIPPTAEESFFELAMLDVKENLYGMVKHHSSLQTALANIDLKIDDWANAKEERKTLIEQWRELLPLDFAKEYYG